MERAAVIASQSDMLWKLGCAIYIKGKLVSLACNKTVGTMPVHKTMHIASSHAEMSAMETLLRKLGLLERARALIQCREKRCHHACDQNRAATAACSERGCCCHHKSSRCHYCHCSATVGRSQKQCHPGRHRVRRCRHPFAVTAAATAAVSPRWAEKEVAAAL